MNKEIREAVFERAQYTCEACKAAPATELDHFRGRAKAPESVANCWALCRPCHRNKTDNVGGRIEWLSIYARHCDTNRVLVEEPLRGAYLAEKKWALDEIAWVIAKKGKMAP